MNKVGAAVTTFSFLLSCFGPSFLCVELQNEIHMVFCCSDYLLFALMIWNSLL